MQNAKCKGESGSQFCILHSAFCIPRQGRGSLEQIVFDDRDVRRSRRAPSLEDVEVEQHEKDFAAHLPSRLQAGEETALRLFEDVIEIVDQRVALPESGARTEAVERR